MNFKIKRLFSILYVCLLFVSGLCLIAFGIYGLYRLIYHFPFVPNVAICPFIIMILFGKIDTFLTWLGYKGITLRYDAYIIWFVILCGLMAVLNVILGLWSFNLWRECDVEVEETIGTAFDEFMNEEYYANDWHILHRNLQCCGVAGFDDFPKPPFSCCDHEDEEVDIPCPKFYGQGCQIPVTRYLKSIYVDSIIVYFLLTMYKGFGVVIILFYYVRLRKVRMEELEEKLEAQRKEAEALELKQKVLKEKEEKAKLAEKTVMIECTDPECDICIYKKTPQKIARKKKRKNLENDPVKDEAEEIELLPPKPPSPPPMPSATA